MTEDDWAPPNDIDFTTPNVARMYDYYLGGKDNYAPDREAAEQVLADAPDLRAGVRWNRSFLERAVQFLAGEAGVRQFLDVGAGLPTQKNTHEVAQETISDARVVYVDRDPVVINHGLDLLSGVDTATIIEADMRRPDEILTHPQLRKLIHFDEPVGVLLLLMLHFLADDEEVLRIMARLREALAPGSYLVISHATAEHRPDVMGQITESYTRASSSVTLRSREQIRRFFDGFQLVEPGLVSLPEWGRDALDGEEAPPRVAWDCLVGVGLKP